MYIVIRVGGACSKCKLYVEGSKSISTLQLERINDDPKTIRELLMDQAYIELSEHECKAEDILEQVDMDL